MSERALLWVIVGLIFVIALIEVAQTFRMNQIWNVLEPLEQLK